MKNPLLLFLLILISTTLVRAQHAETGVSGFVADENEEPMAFATVTLFSLPDSVMVKAGYTLDNGTFAFTHLHAGKYFINISFTGYESHLTKELNITDHSSVNLPDVFLQPIITELGEIVVATTRPIIEVKPDKTVFNVEGSINATGDNGLELLQKAPGVIVDQNERLMLIGKSGVRVYIDGRQSILRGDDLSNFLKSLQSSQIESIEIITQPSSRYEAEGNAGIINIRLIKDKSQGTNGTVSVGHDQAEHGRTNVNANFNTRSDNLNFFGNVNIASGANENFSVFERTTPYQYVNQYKTELSDWNNYSLRSGIDLTSGDYNTFGILFDGYKTDGGSESAITTDIFPYKDGPQSLLLLGNNYTDKTDQSYNLNGNYKFDNRKGTMLNVDLDYGNFSSEATSHQPNNYYDPVNGDLVDVKAYASTSDTDIEIKTLKTDFEKPLAGGKLGTGFKLASVVTNNDYVFYDAIDDTLVLDPNRTNKFDYTENVYAAYLNYSRQWGDISFQLGLRMEQTESKGILTSQTPENGKTVKQSYLDAFPSGGISFQLNDKNAFSLNYSRRIDRPNYQDLNPFEYILDELTYKKGNPFLRPQYSNNIQLNHTYKSMLSTSLSYSKTTDLMAPLADTASNGAVFLTTENIADQDVYALTVSYPFALSKAWNVFVNSGVTQKHNRSDFGEGKTIDVSATTFNIYIQNTYSLPEQFTLEVSGWYRSPGIWGGNFATDKMWALDAGVKKSLWKQRATLKVSVSDIFQTQRWSGSNDFGELQVNANGGWESRRLKLSFSYKLGSNEIKGSRRRSTGMEDESSRIQQN